MVSRPELKSDTNYVNGLAAILLFVVLVAVFLTASFGEAAGFAADASLVAGIGYALMDLHAESAVDVEGFLATFETVGLVLVAATVAAVTLAGREGADEVVTALTDGGQPTEAENESEVEN
jgi:NADH-quinone oxidoreductase subunit J